MRGFLVLFFGIGDISVVAGAAAGGFALTASHLFQTPECRPSKKEPKGFAPAYGPLAGARGTFVTGPIRAQRLRFASLHLLPLCTTASYGRCAPTPGSIPAEGAKDQEPDQKPKPKPKPDQKIAAFGGSYSWIRCGHREIGRLSGRLREQARSHKSKSKAAQLPAAKPHHSTMSASSSAFDPPATSEG